jgi:DNA-binding CsgD family transcriptional regulator
MLDPTMLPDAVRHLREALELFTSMGDLWGIGASNGALGAILLHIEQIETGAHLLGSAREFLRQGHSLLPPFFESVIDEAIASLPETLGPEKAASLLSEGANLPVPERAALPLTVIDQLLTAASQPAEPAQPPVRLTNHQLEIVRLLAEGLKPTQIADRIGRHPSSVYETIDRIQDRLGVNKWEQIVPTAQSHRLLTP